MNWKFWEKPNPPEDRRVWNDDWKVGDTAECIVPQDSWSSTPPWECPPKGTKLTVVGLSEGVNQTLNARAYFLRFSEIKEEWATQGFRKVRAIKIEESEVAQKILNAKPGKDIVREPS